MKPPWAPGGEQGDMEALQTDVMRFMAILGLCLAAIFSLVQSADFLPENSAPVARAAADETLPVEQAGPQSRPEQAQPPQPTQPTQPQPRPAPGQLPAPPAPSTAPIAPEPKQGFELEFASAGALRSLLTAGGATLYATDGEQYWRWWPSGSWSSTDPPASYHEMDAATLPAGFRNSAARVVSGDTVTWGIALPAETHRQLTALVRRHEGGRLVIHADGRVDGPGGFRGR